MDARLTALTVEELVARLATRDPVPGGGSAAALAGAMAAALVGMVVELTTGRPEAEKHGGELADIRTAAASHRGELLRLAEVDAEAYRAVVDARRLPRDTDREQEARRVQTEAALREATRAPMTTARRASDVLDIARRLAPIGNRHAVSDVGVGAELAAAAIRSALLNVEINVPYLPETDEVVGESRELVVTLRSGLDERIGAIRGVVADRLA